MKPYFMMIIGLGILLLSASGTVAQIIPTFTWNFNSVNEEVEVDTRLETDQIAIYNGTLEVDTGSQTDTRVYLRIESSGWASSIEPNELECPMPETVYTFNITVEVAVPRGTPFGSRTIVAKGNWTSDGGAVVGNVPTQSLMISIMPFYMMELSTDNTDLKFERGSLGSLVVNLRNYGNAEDRYRFEITNLPELANDGFNIPVIGTATLQSKEEKYITITFWANGSLGEHEFKVFAASEYSSFKDTNETATMTFNVTVVKPGTLGPDEDDDDDLPGFEAPVAFMAIAVSALAITRKRSQSY